MLLLVGYLACCVGSYGFTLADFQSTGGPQSRRQDMGMAVIFSTLGPLSLVLAFCLSGFGEHGWRLR